MFFRHVQEMTFKCAEESYCDVTGAWGGDASHRGGRFLGWTPLPDGELLNPLCGKNMLGVLRSRHGSRLAMAMGVADHGWAWHTVACHAATHHAMPQRAAPCHVMTSPAMLWQGNQAAPQAFVS